MNAIHKQPESAERELPIEYHPLQPFLPEKTRILFLGSFPPQTKRWCMPFFYPNYINDHWRIVGSAFFNDRNYFVDVANRTFLLERIKPFLNQQGIGYFDTATAVRRLKDNASDKYLEVVIATDIQALIAPLNELRVIAVTGERAAETLCSTMGIATPAVGNHVALGGERETVVYRLPSSSRAYPLAFDKKVEAYRQMYRFAGLLQDETIEQ